MTEAEHCEQVALINWCRAARGKYPELDLLFAIPNGGKRNRVVAAKLRREGVLPWMPDLCLPYSRNGFGALYIEMKRPEIKSIGQAKGYVSKEQKARHEQLRSAGNKVVVTYGWMEAKQKLEEYLSKN